MPKKPLSPKEKEKRQKIIAAVLLVVLIGVGAFQFPKMWKLMHPKAPDEASSTPTATTPPPNSPLPTSLAGATTPESTPATSPSTGGATASAGQLVQFGRFSSKNPFVQQVRSCAGECAPTSGGSTGSGSTGSASNPSGSKGSGTSTTPTTPPAPPSGSGSGSGTSTTPSKPTSAVISVNGAREPVALGASFPSSSPTFVLRSLTRKSAQIGIAGGSLSDGSGSVTLKLGKTLTLMNTADGTRYALILVAVA
jgi:hypothetical protein